MNEWLVQLDEEEKNNQKSVYKTVQLSKISEANN